MAPQTNSKPLNPGCQSIWLAIGLAACFALLGAPPGRADSPITIGNYCLDTDGSYTFLAACSPGKKSQLWRWEPVNKSAYKTKILGYTIPDGNTAAQVVNFQHGKCLDAWGARLNSGDTVGLYACNNQHNQMWDFQSGLFEVGYWGKTAIKCLAVPNANFKPGQRLIIWDCADKNKSPDRDLRRRSQTFYAYLAYFTSFGSGTLCVETDGFKVVVAKCGQKTRMEQWWSPREVSYIPPYTAKYAKMETGSFDERIRGKCLEVSGAWYADGAQLRIGQCKGGGFQTFYFKLLALKVLPFRYMIDAGKDGKCLAVDNGWKAGSNLVLRSCNEGDANQHFEVFPDLTELPK